MAGDFFQFRKFVVHQDKCAMKVCTDSCLFGAYMAAEIFVSDPDINDVLDIGAGTGLLTLMVAQKLNATFDAVEIDEDAAAQMRENFLRTPWNGRLNVVCSDARALKPKKKYDLVFSNPPFHENGLKSDSRKAALARHDEGILLSELAQITAACIDEDGRFYIMVPAYRSSYMKGQLNGAGLTVNKEVIGSHSKQHAPFRSILSGDKNFGAVKADRESICICEEEQYTDVFKNLLHDYYLYL